MQGHTKAIRAVAFSPDAQRTVTGSDDTTAILWDTAKGQPIHTLRGHTAAITSVAFNANGKRLLTGSEDKSAILWDADSGQRRGEFTGQHKSGVTAVAFSPDGSKVLTASADARPILWNSETSERVRAFEGHSGAVTCAAFSPDGTQVATGSADRTAILWHSEKTLWVCRFEGHEGGVLSVAFHPNGRQVLTGSTDQTARLWDIEKKDAIKTFKGHKGRITSVAFCSDGTQVLTASDDTTAVLWDAATGAQLFTFHGHAAPVTAIAVSADAQQVLTGSFDNTAVLWKWKPPSAKEPDQPDEKDAAELVASGKPPPPAPDSPGDKSRPSETPSGEPKHSAAVEPPPPQKPLDASKPEPSPSEPPPLAVVPFAEAQAKKHQADWAFHLDVQSEITNTIGMKLALIPPGEFQMGSPDSDKDAEATEKPQHRVRITKAFYLGVCEVTQTEYQQVMGANPSHFKESGETAPVENVSWDEAVEFCRKLSALAAEQAAGRVYRLPTEAEWEYACRAGTETRYCFGDGEGELGEHAWYSGNSGSKSHRVGEKKPNAWGVYDMHGNVWEWCQDCWAVDYYGASPLDDPPGPTGGSFRVVRGGGWCFVASYCRAADRFWRLPSNRYVNLGFRLARAVSFPH